jgi:hypothetical protein
MSALASPQMTLPTHSLKIENIKQKLLHSTVLDHVATGDLKLSK